MEAQDGPLKAFIGYDPREDDAFRVCKSSITRHASDCVEIEPLKESILRHDGIYTRTFTERDGQKYDDLDGKPFSTEFSFTRFLVPYLCGYRGWALFLDCDMMLTRDIKEVFSLADDRYAAMCVKHDFRPEEGIKMDGQKQEPYPRKNWSSFVLFNCARNHQLTPDVVNNATGQFLHGFGWLRDDEIGELPAEWNFLVGHTLPANLHFTDGVPSMANYEDSDYADAWREELGRT